jgi:nicotinate-nucleotide adenylyltransferase
MSLIGLLGGAFNPPHLGHIRLAELALENLHLDQVRFIPTAQSPHKATQGPPAEIRMDLLELALQTTGKPFHVDPIELERGGVSYTVDTLETLSAREPGNSWILLVGSDQLPGLSGWVRLPRILELASIGVAPRPGFSSDIDIAMADRVRSTWSGQPGEIIWLPGTGTHLASSDLREALARCENPEGLPIQVRDTIQRQFLYR